MINNRTGLLGVIGDPIEHSISPALHNFVLKSLDLNYCYLSFHVKIRKIQEFLTGFNTLGFHGINVTIPHKQNVIPFMDQLSSEASLLGAVNTIHFEAQKMVGHNTDSTGFLRSLGDIKNQLKNKHVIILGAGGAARAIIYALIKQKVAQIQILNRTTSKAETLANYFREKINFMDISVKPLETKYLEASLDKAFMLINATAAGMYPDMTASPIDDSIEIPNSLIVYDLIYNPDETLFLKKARLAGAKVFNGLDMLIFQGIAALEIWLKQPILIDDFLPKLRNHLLDQI